MLRVPAEPERPVCRHSRQSKLSIERSPELVLITSTIQFFNAPGTTIGINHAPVGLGLLKAMQARLVGPVRPGL